MEGLDLSLFVGGTEGPIWMSVDIYHGCQRKGGYTICVPSCLRDMDSPHSSSLLVQTFGIFILLMFPITITDISTKEFLPGFIIFCHGSIVYSLTIEIML